MSRISHEVSEQLTALYSVKNYRSNVDGNGNVAPLDIYYLEVFL